MPPGPAYNWLCVLLSTADILSHAARLRGCQSAYALTQHDRVNLETSYSPASTPAIKKVQLEETVGFLPNDVPPARTHEPSRQPNTPEPLVREVQPPISQVVIEGSVLNNTVGQPPVTRLHPSTPVDASPTPEPITRSNNLQSSKVPSSRIGRLFHYGGLAASLGYGAASEIIRRTGDTSHTQNSSVMMSEANIKRLVSKLSQMRGAALKLGQFMSIQDTHILPPEIDKIFRRVQNSAHYMPDWQLEKVLNSSLGPDWAQSFTSFDRIPFAAASIGQVHTAVLAPSVSPTGMPERVAVKIQFPNIAHSIESDLAYIKLLLTVSSLLPKGLFLDKTIQVMKGELADECNYTREASFLKSFGSPEFLGGDSRTNCVLVMQHMSGFSVGEANASGLDQRDRNDIAAWVIELCLKELFEFRTMQTDPNWSNFLWNPESRQIMLDAHVNSMILLATPFKSTTPQPFSFGQGSAWTDITAAIRSHIPLMLQHRLTPPPRETYSLNRKLSGAFLLASRLEATVDTKSIWDKVVSKYRYDS
ncbi:ABC1 family-domain-containing protein [Infundibulicybe gibba]|nr:ABC1 family-domain-containing protein [Infundibulicybe gibba]